ncbi:MAG: universal stress protein [Fimbriimonadaceae bacterium]|nr:universal stress protein [Fimbriimonadaceae bacterium]
MNILLATDGSNHARLGEILLSKMPGLKGSRVTVACVVTSPNLFYTGLEPFGGMALAEQAQIMIDQSREHAQGLVDQVCSRLREAGFEAEGIIPEGEIGGCLVELVKQHDIQLAVIGSRGMGGLKGLIFGSVARKMAHDAPCSLLIARAYKGMTAEESWPIVQQKDKLSALIAVDGSPGSKVALDEVAMMGPLSFAELGVVCAQPLGVLPSGIEPASFKEFYQYDEEMASAAIEASKSQLDGCATNVYGETELSRPADLIKKVAEDHKADLVVLSATRHGTIERALLGSVSSEVVSESPCSVWLVRVKPTE